MKRTTFSFWSFSLLDECFEVLNIKSPNFCYVLCLREGIKTKVCGLKKYPLTSRELKKAVLRRHTCVPGVLLPRLPNGTPHLQNKSVQKITCLSWLLQMVFINLHWTVLCSLQIYSIGYKSHCRRERNRSNV